MSVARLARALAVAAVLVAFPAGAADRSAALAVGDEVPDFTLGDQHGQPFRLSDALRGRRFIVLAFYVKAFTGG